MNRWPNGWWVAPACIGSALIWAAMTCVAFGTVIVKNDSGGSLSNRLLRIEKMRITGEPVRIIGFCGSACTMYLGLPNACVSRRARLAFHGPQTQYYGIGLSHFNFEKWSYVMADQYPPRIRAKYLQEWRYTTMGAIYITGTEAIKMGARECK